MKKIFVAWLLALIAPFSFGQSYPSPTYKNLTVTTSFTATGLVTPTDLAIQAANTVLANVTGLSASPIAFSMPSCATPASALQWTNGTGFTCNSSFNPTVATNAALQALSTVAAPTVVRLGFYAIGDVPPLQYIASGAPCALNGGNGDNGSQVKSANGLCWLAKFPNSDGADIRQFGAQSNNSSFNSTTAFQNAVAASDDVYVPPGNFYINATISNLSGAFIHGTWGSNLRPFAAGDVLTLTNGNFNTIRDIAFVGNSSMAGSGLVLVTTANTTLENLLAESFPVYGITCQGTSVNASSGVVVKNSYMLFNGTANLYFSYCNDFHITGNQMGSNTSSPFTTYGIQLSNSSAGQITDNFIWQNNTGVSISTSNFNWISRNRITQSQQSGLVISTGSFNHITDNQFYSNSLATSAGAPDFSLTGGNTTVIDANQFYSWDGIAHVNYNITVDSTSTITTISGNQFSWYVTNPTNISVSATSTSMSGNYPAQNGTSNNAATGTFAGITASSMGGGGTTIYLGNGGGNATESNVYFPVAAPGAISCFVVNTSSAPGVGQSYTVNLRKNNVSTPLTGVISGSSSFGALVCANGNWVGANSNDNIDIQVVSSAGAAAAIFRYSISLQQ